MKQHLLILTYHNIIRLPDSYPPDKYHPDIHPPVLFHQGKYHPYRCIFTGEVIVRGVFFQGVTVRPRVRCTVSYVSYRRWSIAQRNSVEKQLCWRNLKRLIELVHEIQQIFPNLLHFLHKPMTNGQNQTISISYLQINVL